MGRTTPSPNKDPHGPCRGLTPQPIHRPSGISKDPRSPESSQRLMDIPVVTLIRTDTTLDHQQLRTEHFHASLCIFILLKNTDTTELFMQERRREKCATAK